MLEESLWLLKIALIVGKFMLKMLAGYALND